MENIGFWNFKDEVWNDFEKMGLKLRQSSLALVRGWIEYGGLFGCNLWSFHTLEIDVKVSKFEWVWPRWSLILLRWGNMVLAMRIQGGVLVIIVVIELVSFNVLNMDKV